MDMEISTTTRPAQYVDYDGIMWPTMVTRESLNAIKDFETWEDDVWVATYPKAGKFIQWPKHTWHDIIFT